MLQINLFSFFLPGPLQQWALQVNKAMCQRQVSTCNLTVAMGQWNTAPLCSEYNSEYNVRHYSSGSYNYKYKPCLFF